jgi:NAD-dependent deacetylase
MTNQIEKLKEAIKESNKIVIFSGAGLSTNSGIPDFRSADGLYNQETGLNIRPEEIISHTFFVNNPDYFFSFYFDKMVYLDAKPNLAHKYFAKLEKEGKVLAVVTQNIDNLHQMAGSQNVIELHGSVERNYCMKCHKFYPLKEVYNEKHLIPHCSCGGIIKPDVVLYEENLDETAITKALEAISTADMLIVVGTSLTVYPAASFINYFRGKTVVVINQSEIQISGAQNTLIIREKIGKVFTELAALQGIEL